MKIQLLNHQKKVLYELEKSELFPDYCSVLKEAIAYNVDLTGLLIESEYIDGVVWRGVNMKGITIKNCSMRGAKLLECYGDNLSFDSCDLSGLKVQKTKLNGVYISDSNLIGLSFRNSSSNNAFIDCSNCSKASFYESNIENTTFHTCNISDAVFDACNLDGTAFIHSEPSKLWIKDACFINCLKVGCDMSFVDDISLLYFWETNIRDIQYKNEERFTEVENTHSKVIYAIDSDTVWWKPYSWSHNKVKIFRSNLDSFCNEVQNGFPITDLHPKMDDFEIEKELLLVCRYLKSWV